jgi:hypothetical protein
LDSPVSKACRRAGANLSAVAKDNVASHSDIVGGGGPGDIYLCRGDRGGCHILGYARRLGVRKRRGLYRKAIRLRGDVSCRIFGFDGVRVGRVRLRGRVSVACSGHTRRNHTAVSQDDVAGYSDIVGRRGPAQSDFNRRRPYKGG